jgi:glycosyltransferase involved in cell wall biosynthesis
MAAAAGHWARPDALIATCHGWGSGRPDDMDLEDSLAYQLCDSVVTYSDHWAERLRRDLGVSDPQVILMGLNLDRFPPLPEQRLAESSPVRIVTVCELTPRKGVDILLNAMPMLWKQMPEAELHIIGHGDAADALQLLAAKIDPGMRRVFFHGAVANPYVRLGDFDLFVLASRSDNLPVVLPEAMLARLPIVATAVGGIPGLISGAACGACVPPESAAALAEAMIGRLNEGRDAISSLGIKGERFVRDRMDVRKTAAELETIYRDALRKRGRLDRVP